MIRRQPRLLLLAAALLALFCRPAFAADPPFAGWAAMVVAGDWRASSGGDTQAFDNARRDVSAALVHAGFGQVLQYSLRPARKGDDPALVTEAKTAIAAFMERAAQAQGGCLFYVTSHGDTNGAVFGPGVTLSPSMLGRVLDEACAGRPTVAVISACYSGVFVEPLAKPARMILTAARADRSSFGCGEENRYPYFDDCLLQSLPKARDFTALGPLVQACVAAMEKATGASPASEPQLFIGADFRAQAPLLAFAHSVAGEAASRTRR